MRYVKTKSFYEGDNKNDVKQTNDSNDEDLFLLTNDGLLKFSQQISRIYDAKEFYLKLTLKKDQEIILERKNGSLVPQRNAVNCGYTLVGRAQNYFKSSKALCTDGESSDDQEYVYINEHSSLYYTGESEEHTIYVRIYDNIYNILNDRWVVLSIE